MFTRMAFNPTNGLKNKTVFDTTPVSEDAAREQVQTPLNQLRDALNALMAALESAETDASGAENLGSAAIYGVDGETVREQIISVKQQIDDISTGSVSDGSITTPKLADGVLSADETGRAKMADGFVNTDKLSDGVLSADETGRAKMADGFVSTDKLSDGVLSADATGRAKMADGFLSADATGRAKMANSFVSTEKLGTVQSITLAPGHTLSYDYPTNRLMLNVQGCTPVQLAPIVFGTGANPPAGTFPRGTLYLRHQA